MPLRIACNLKGGFIAPFLLLAMLLPLPVLAAESEWQFENWAGPPVPVRLFVPDDVKPDTKIVIVMHGASRDAPRYYRDWKAQGAKLGFVVVVPEFTAASFPGSDYYNLGNVFKQNGRSNRDESLWTFSAIEPLFDEVVERLNSAQSRYTIYGHSAGAQFVHRFMYYKPDARVERFIAANAGWYTLPLTEVGYPYGLRNAHIERSELARIFASPLLLLLGDRDIETAGESLRSTKEAEAQGPHRLARGYTMYRLAKKRAEKLGLPFSWENFVVKGADHDNAKMAPAAAEKIVQ